MTKLGTETTESLLAAERSSHQRFERARIARLRAEADWLEQRGDDAKREFDLAFEAERRTRNALTAAASRRREAESQSNSNGQGGAE